VKNLRARITLGLHGSQKNIILSEVKATANQKAKKSTKITLQGSVREIYETPTTTIM